MLTDIQKKSLQTK